MTVLQGLHPVRYNELNLPLADGVALTMLCQDGRPLINILNSDHLTKVLDLTSSGSAELNFETISGRHRAACLYSEGSFNITLTKTSRVLEFIVFSTGEESDLQITISFNKNDRLLHVLYGSQGEHEVFEISQGFTPQKRPETRYLR